MSNKSTIVAGSTALSQDVLANLGFKRVAAAEGVVEYRYPANGLTVLLKEDHSTPAVTFMVVYNCGSREEGAGTTGSAHFFEHLMFKGTRRFDPLEGNGPMDLFGRVGATLNANTSYDRTRYFEVVSADQLELCVKVEADRMRNLKNRKADRDSEMTVVRNEFERGENSPSNALFKAVMATAFTEHPYHYPVIGSRSDVEGVPMQRMVEFYDQYYWPNNATVLVVGKFDSENALSLIARYFGKIPRSPRQIPQMYTVEPRQEGERRVEVRRSGSLPLITLAFHIPESRHADSYPLAALGMILGNSSKPGSRLYKALTETSLVSSASAQAFLLKDPGVFLLSATLTPGTELKTVEDAVLAEIERVSTELVSDEELRRVKAANRKGTTLQSDDPMQYANMLSNAVGVDSWKWHVRYDDHFDAVTPEDIRRVAQTYLNAANRTVGHFIPTKGTGANGPKPAATKPRKGGPRKQRRVKLAVTPPNTTFSADSKRVVLPNGLTVVVLKRGNGSVAITTNTAAGTLFAKSGGNGLVASATASLLATGSRNFSKTQIGETMEEMGDTFGFGADTFAAKSDTFITSGDYEKFIALLADVMTAPTLDEGELKKLLPRYRANLTNSLNDTGARAQNALMRAAYPAGHPFRPSTFEEQLAQLDQLTIEDVRRFHAEHYSPKSTVLTVVGDIDVDRAIAAVEKHFGSWEGPERKPIVVPPVEKTEATEGERTLKVHLPDKANVDIVIGHASELARNSDDYFAARIAVNALGQSTIADRLGKVVRVQHGLTYGINARFGDTAFGATPYLISVSTNPANVAKVLELVNQVVGDYVANGISDEELEDKVNAATGGFLVGLRGSSGISSILCEMEFLGFGAAGMDAVVGGYLAVTKDAVNAAIRKHLSLDRSIIVLAGTVE